MPHDASPIRLLLIEDDELSREFLTIQLSAEGYSVHPVESGDAALLHLALPAAFPDAILTDLQMPGISGPELAQHLRSLASAQESRKIVLVAMSASQPEPSLLVGYDAFLLKPFTMAQFANSLKPKETASASIDRAKPDETTDSLDPTLHQKLVSAIPAMQLQELYTMFLTDATLRIGRMRIAAEADDDTTYRKESHAIKGAASMVGATELHRLAAAGEQQGIAHANHVASLDEMLMACERLRRILVEHESRANN